MTAANIIIKGKRRIIKSIMKGGEKIKVNCKEIKYTSGMTVQDPSWPVISRIAERLARSLWLRIMQTS